MKSTTDEQLDKLLRSLLAPPPLDTLDDAALHSMLDDAQRDAESTVPFPEKQHHGIIRWTGLIAAAAAVLLLLGIAIFSRDDNDEAPPAVAGEDEPGDSLPFNEAMIISTPPPSYEETVTIDLDLPEPWWSEDQVSIDRPHLEKPGSRGAQDSFDAPEGTRLLSRGAAVTSSDPEPLVGNLQMITDGRKDGSATSHVEFGPGRQWVQVDLKNSREVWAIALWHYHQRPRAYDDVVIELSDDPDFEKGVVILFNNDHDNSSGMGTGKDPAWIETHHGRLIMAGGIQARYVRLFSNGNTANEMNHYTEVEIYGR